MKKLLASSCIVFLSHTFSMAQCQLTPISLNQRVNQSELIIEGKVVDKVSFWNYDNTMIYTTNKVMIYKVFKGDVQSDYIDIVTEGGQVDNYMITTSNLLELQKDQVGVFMCKASQITVPSSDQVTYGVYSSAQGFIKYDLNAITASDIFNSYESISGDVYTQIENLTQQSATVVNAVTFTGNVPSVKGVTTFTGPSISSFSPSVSTAGTYSTITINGSGFGSSQDSTSNVQFKNANDGGATYIKPIATEYTSWSDTQIIVRVTKSAGTGTIQVVVPGGTATSGGTLTVSYAVMNATYDGNRYYTDHNNDNGTGGYTWRMNTSFDGNASANASFARALKTWRCTTGVNWIIGATTGTSAESRDGTCLVAFRSDLDAGVLGTCYSFWSGCGSTWFVDELDIIFDDTDVTWNYGPDAVAGGESDFESVALHELGHGHQLGHVNSGGAVMHYSITTGTQNRVLGANDIAGGGHVHTRSLVTNACGEGAMTNYTTCVGTTKIRTEDCNTTLSYWEKFIYTDQIVGASTYQYHVTDDGSFDQTVTRSSNQLKLVEIAGIVPSTQYHIEVKAQLNGNWGDYGASCDVTSSTIPMTKLRDADCDGSVSSIDQTVYADQVAGSQNFRYHVVDNATNGAVLDETYTRGNSSTDFRLSWISGIQLSTVYRVEVVANINGNWGNTGISCTLTTPSSLPTTTLRSVDCGIALSSMEQDVYADQVSGAEDFQYNVKDHATGGSVLNQTYTRGSNATNFRLAWISGVQLGTSYRVTVRAKINGVYAAFGGYCVITSPASLPTTQIRTVDCGSTVASNQQRIYADQVSGAQAYRFRVNGTGVSNFEYTTSSGSDNSMRFELIPGVVLATGYTINVKAQLNGSFAAYGSSCVVNTPASVQATKVTNARCNTVLPSVNTTVYADRVPKAQTYQWHIFDGGTFDRTYTSPSGKRNNVKLSWFSGWQLSTVYSAEVRAMVGGAFGTYGTVCSLTTPASAPKDEDGDGIGHGGLIIDNITGEILSDERGTIEEETINVNLFPNPADGGLVNVYVDGLETEGDMIIQVFDMIGNLIFSQASTASNGTIITQVNTSNLAKGIYVMKLTHANGSSAVERLIVK